MFERDCSLQRRHQKVIEEAPAPGMTDDVRKAMTDAAVQAAKAVNYVGAGTVEFIVDGSGKLRKDGFWFMEMNTRLQVEHPVTEMITGLDLVELQIRVAQGEKLPKQKDIKMKGHAVEARLYAEDPANDFLPSIGKITGFGLKSYSDNISERVETGVTEGDVISIFYDPMIAKYIMHAATRKTAIYELRDGLEWGTINGLSTNIGFLIRLLDLQEFKDGTPTTHLIPKKINDLINDPNQIPELGYANAAVSALLDKKYQSRKKQITGKRTLTPFDDFNAFRINQPNKTQIVFERENEPLCVEIIPLNGQWECIIENNKYLIFDSDIDGKDDSLNTLKFLDAWYSSINPTNVVLTRMGKELIIPFYESSFNNSTSASNALTAPMPGKIIAVNAKAGDSVKAGDPLIVMEAMKMEMTLEAPRDGVVAEIMAQVDALVTDGEMLLNLETIEKET